MFIREDIRVILDGCWHVRKPNKTPIDMSQVLVKTHGRPDCV